MEAEGHVESAKSADMGEVLVGLVIMIVIWNVLRVRKDINEKNDRIAKELKEAEEEKKCLEGELEATKTDLEVKDKVANALKNTLGLMAHNLRRDREQLSLEEQKLEEEIERVQKCADDNRTQSQRTQDLLKFALKFQDFCQDNHLVKMTQWADGKEEEGESM